MLRESLVALSHDQIHIVEFEEWNRRVHDVVPRENKRLVKTTMSKGDFKNLMMKEYDKFLKHKRSCREVHIYMIK
jgi:hypothetical protein